MYNSNIYTQCMIRNSELLRNGYSIYANASRDKKSALLLSRNIQLISEPTRPSSGSFFLHFLHSFLRMLVFVFCLTLALRLTFLFDTSLSLAYSLL